jgi:hypothetical protein
MTRTLITAATLASLVTLPFPARAEDLASQIVGLWKYVSLATKEVASGKETKLFGDNPKGYVLYTKSGRSMWVLVGDNRAKPAGAAVTDAEAVGLFRTFASGSGTYKVEGKTLLATFDTSWNERWTGTTQKRYVEIAGNRLTLTSDPMKATATGLEIVITSVLERAD